MIGNKFQLAVYRNPDGSPMKDANGRMKFVTTKNMNQTLYTLINAQGKTAYVTKEQILKNARQISNLGVSNGQIYPVIDKDEKMRSAKAAGIVSKTRDPKTGKEILDVNEEALEREISRRTRVSPSIVAKVLEMENVILTECGVYY